MLVLSTWNSNQLFLSIAISKVTNVGKPILRKLESFLKQILPGQSSVRFIAATSKPCLFSCLLPLYPTWIKCPASCGWIGANQLNVHNEQVIYYDRLLSHLKPKESFLIMEDQALEHRVLHSLNGSSFIVVYDKWASCDPQDCLFSCNMFVIIIHLIQTQYEQWQFQTQVLTPPALSKAKHIGILSTCSQQAAASLACFQRCFYLPSG